MSLYSRRERYRPSHSRVMTWQDVVFSHFRGAINPHLRIARRVIAYQIQRNIWTLRHHPSYNRSTRACTRKSPKTSYVVTPHRSTDVMNTLPPRYAACYGHAVSLNKWLLLKSNKHVPKSLLNSWSKVYKNSLMLSPDGSVRHAGECVPGTREHFMQT